MILIDKKVGETPLELLNRLRQEQPEVADATLSYAGRLDPMAEGQMLVLVGEENNEREKFLGLDKEYIATFLVGVSTDSGDILGLITQTATPARHAEALEPVQNESLTKDIEHIKGLTEQTYPWFSGKTVDGTKLFDLFKKGETDVERPVKKVSIKSIELQGVQFIDTEELKTYIFESIGKVTGDFRQEKILDRWQIFFDTYKDSKNITFVTFEVRLLVSSGTYIRALTENFSTPTTLLKLVRTKIHLPEV